jgi:hypothetical protein
MKRELGKGCGSWLHSSWASSKYRQAKDGRTACDESLNFFFFLFFVSNQLFPYIFYFGYMQCSKISYGYMMFYVYVRAGQYW